MFRRVAVWIFAVTIPILGIASAAPADAAVSIAHKQQPHCTATYFDLGADEGISLNCTNADHDFQVIARCAGFLGDVWWQDGSVAKKRGGDSIAVCHGLLIFGADVIDYRVREVSR